MEKLDSYNIDLKNMRESYAEYKYELNGDFFADIEAPDIEKGKLNVSLSVQKAAGAFVLDFVIEGEVTVTCDRCLDEMQVPVYTEDSMKVKLGPEYSDDDEIVIIPENEGIINVAWNIYEFIMLSLPMKHVHKEGECNKEMLETLSPLLRTDAQDDDFEDDEFPSDVDVEESEDSETEKETDPRWDALKKILNNN
ncbi:MAG: DUF177 domain-containing protein [Phocaeicola sp.]|nr:DUF177 domain-containing protein [Phocaeicola sp.]